MGPIVCLGASALRGRASPLPWAAQLARLLALRRPGRQPWASGRHPESFALRRVGRTARLQRELEQLAAAPDLLVKRRAFELLSRFMPTPLRRSLAFARTISRIIPR